MKTLAIVLERTGTLDTEWVWGEEILAIGLAHGLGRHYRTQVVSERWVQENDRVGRYDIALYLRECFVQGIGRLNLLWLQNGIESFHRGMSDEAWIDRCIVSQLPRFDVIAAASRRWCEIAAGHGSRTLFFPQFADCDVYRKVSPATSAAPYDVVYVSNNIKGERVYERFLYPVVEHCAANGLRLGIFGGGWETARRWDLLRRYHQGPAHPGSVPGLYSSARVVLSIHLESQRRFGLITSRVYEALACGAVVVSDRVDGNDPFFEETCRFADDAGTMVANLEAALAMTDGERAAHAFRVRSVIQRSHSPLARARALKSTIDALGEPLS